MVLLGGNCFQLRINTCGAQVDVSSRETGMVVVVVVVVRGRRNSPECANVHGVTHSVLVVLCVMF